MPRNASQGNMQDIVGGDYKNLLKDIKEDINKWKEIYSRAENKISRETSVLYQDTIDSSKITPKIVLFYYYYFLRFWQDDYKTWKSKDVKIWREIRCSVCLLHSWPRAPEQQLSQCRFCKDRNKGTRGTVPVCSFGNGGGDEGGCPQKRAKTPGSQCGKQREERNKGRKGLHCSLTSISISKG